MVDQAFQGLNCLTGSSAPTTSTKGYVGQGYVNGSDYYICVGVAGNTYTWWKVQKAENGKVLSDNNYAASDKALVNTIANKVNKSQVKSVTGNSGTDIMSQAAITNALKEKVDTELGKGLSTNDFDDSAREAVDSISNKIDVSDIQDATGQGTEFVMSQKATTDAIQAVDNKFNPTDVAFKELTTTVKRIVFVNSEAELPSPRDSSTLYLVKEV